MKVYALLSNYFDKCDNWESIESLYLNSFDAITECNRLENENSDPSQSYWIKEMEVK